jgi:hypothetical protein
LSESLIVKLQKPIGMNRVNQVVLQESSEKNLKELTLFLVLILARYPELRCRIF